MKILILLAVIILILGCSDMCDKADKNVLIEADRAFSKMSEEKGMYESFDYFMDDSAVMYRDGQHPLEGREKIRENLSKNPDATLTWEPTKAEIAESGDLGYTLGKWTYTTKDSSGLESTSFGYYVSIWKKQSNGSWKWVFDSGVSAPAEE
ncbi:MAG: DUF4440 domain-containing protein [candidate division Zixibacteria bacterium]|nr:DUF4440 domain-containing protein [candidate division Zixibacteria bacterium]